MGVGVEPMAIVVGHGQAANREAVGIAGILAYWRHYSSDYRKRASPASV